MDHHRVYLSGPIWGRTFRNVKEWRRQVFNELADYAEILDPMRERQLHPGQTEDDFILTSLDSPDASIATDRGIIARDHHDTITSTILIVNLLEATSPSIGTISEMAWAYDRRIPVITIMEPSGNPHEHAFVREMTSFRVDSVERAIIVAKSIMGVSLYTTWDNWDA